MPYKRTEFLKSSLCCIALILLLPGIILIKNSYSGVVNLHVSLNAICCYIPLALRAQFTGIHVAVVACGDRVPETLTNIKATVLFAKSIVKFHIFTEDHLKNEFLQVIKTWPAPFRVKFEFEIYSITYPNDGHDKQWKKLFKLCASQRLFLPEILKEVDAILYVDTDVLFVSPVDEIWKLFSEFNLTHLAAMSPEHESTNSAWYTRFARHPYYGITGINSGVMLMNLTRVRLASYKNDVSFQTMNWSKMLLPLYQKYRLNITWGDQDLLNIIFHHNPEMLHTFSCKWNYRPDHCMYMPACSSANKEGVMILHGSRRAFQPGSKWPSFRAIYTAIEEHPFSFDMSNIFKKAKEKMSVLPDSPCKKSSNNILTTILNFVDAGSFQLKYDHSDL